MPVLENQHIGVVSVIDHLETTAPEDVLLTVLLPVLSQPPSLVSATLEIIHCLHFNHLRYLVPPLYHILRKVVNLVVAVQGIYVKDLALPVEGQSDEFVVDETARKAEPVEE
jgi:hypothetical protein